MKKVLAISAAIILASCSSEEKPAEGGIVNEPSIERSFFAKGADISWVTQMEADGIKFYNSAGQETECTAVMKETGVNSIRLRVWVDPKDGWCAKEDVLAKAKRAQEAGMKIMIDFHYSDTWADPGSQKIPAAWSGHTVPELAKAVSAHTKDLLETLKDNGVDVEWIQIGNETDSGMLHPFGNISDAGNIPKFAELFNAGAKAAKEIYEDAAIILHRSNGHDNGGFSWFLNIARTQNLNYDIIGMSLYPSWWENGGHTSWEKNTGLCMENIRSSAKTYGKPVMICEFGMPASEPEMAKDALNFIMDKAKEMKELHGIFYWEPEVYGGWKPADYEALGWSSYDKGAFKDGKPTAALEPFKQTIQ